MQRAELFEAERPRLIRIAARLLSDPVEAEDLAQQAWLRLQRQDTDPDNLPAWLTTVVTRLCLDRLRTKVPVPAAAVEPSETVPDIAEEFALADTVGIALQVVLDRLSPHERVAFVLHDSFGFEFATIAAILDTSPSAARKLASRARAKVRQPVPEDALADWEVVDAFMSAARHGQFDRLLRLLAPDAAVSADPAAISAGTPEQIDGSQQVASFFDGSARAALPVFVGDRPGSAWFLRGEAKVVFDFTVADGTIQHIRFVADPDVLAHLSRRDGQHRRG